MKIKSRSKIAAVLAAAGLVFSSTPAHAVDLQGSGATFVAPLLEACKAGFAKSTSHSYTYGGGGSGTGQKNSDASVGDFWFSDSAYRAGTRTSIIHAPVVAAPIAVMHNLPTSRQLYLSPATIAGIFGGTIKTWNDPAIVADNNRSVTEVIYKKDAFGNAKLDKNGKPEVLGEIPSIRPAPRVVLGGPGWNRKEVKSAVLVDDLLDACEEIMRAVGA